LKKVGRADNSYIQTPSRFLEGLTPEHAEVMSRFIRALVGGIIGLALTGLFAGVIIAVIAVALFGDQSQTIQLLNTALTLAGSTLGAVLGYFLGRGEAKSR
jgi:TRAP-type C4-dicarboxylate transport system permease small subunit